MTLKQIEFETDEGFGHKARIGLIVLETDQTVEAEMRQIHIPGVDWYHSRIPNDSEVTPSTLTDMKQRLPVAASLLPKEFAFDAIGYCCTSAATLIGEEAVTGAIQESHPGVACSNPITAAVTAFQALEVSRISVLTPYTAEVTAPIISFFNHSGLEVEKVASFLEPSDYVVARISEDSVAAGVRDLANSDCEAVFVSCTSLRSFGIVAALEQELGKPIVSSNLAISWHLLRLAGVEDSFNDFSQLFMKQL